MATNQVAYVTPIHFFSIMALRNRKFEVHSYLAEFSALPTNRDKVNFVYKDLKKYKIFPKSYKDVKEDKVAISHREKGNLHFGSGNKRDAFFAYTTSMATAKSKEVMSLAFANRSACLFKYGRFQDCVQDIDRAFANNYPNNLKPKLVQRRENALKMQRTIPAYHFTTPKIPQSKKNPKIQSARDCVEIKVNEEYGRHVVATKDIKIGEVIGVEEPFTKILIHDLRTHCHECFEICFCVIPCDFCCSFFFCSEECKTKAFEKYHRYECKIFTTLLICGVKDRQMMALRAAILAKEDYNNINSLTLDFDEIYRSDSYKEVHNLQTSSDKRAPEELLHMTLVASFMLHFLEKETNFFTGNEAQIMKDRDAFKEIVMRQLQMLDLNKMPIYENSTHAFMSQRNYFAFGIYSFGSIFNHSCCHNVETVQYGATMVFRAVNTIKKGQQCFVSYDRINYVNWNKPSRQAHLKKSFFFDCKCRACENSWYDGNLEQMRFRFPIHIDLKMSESEFLVLTVGLGDSDVEVARKYMAYLGERLKQLEGIEPWGNVPAIKGLLIQCLDILGNKRVCVF